MNERKVLNIIPSCGCDKIMPVALVYMFYIILHSHIGPGGGFQGGILASAVIVFIHLGYDYKTLTNTISLEFMRKTEGVALVAYIVIAFIGVTLGANFCANFAYQRGNIGDLLSSGTIAWMDEAVGLNVLTGSSVLSIILLGIIQKEKEEENK